MFLETNWFETWGLFLDHNTIYQSSIISEICRYQISHHVVASIKDSFQEFDQTSNINSNPQIYLAICLLLLASISFKLTKAVFRTALDCWSPKKRPSSQHERIYST